MSTHRPRAQSQSRSPSAQRADKSPSRARGVASPKVSRKKPAQLVPQRRGIIDDHSVQSIGGEQERWSATPREILAVRELFWHNAIRELLNGLSVLQQQQPEIFDGRFSVLTQGGSGGSERIPIGQITPMFACSVPGSTADRETSAAVQSTVFRIVTPAGEVFTLPLHEIRAMHALTPELIDQLHKAASLASNTPGTDDDDLSSVPFGLAAYAALPKLPTTPAPVQPSE